MKKGIDKAGKIWYNNPRFAGYWSTTKNILKIFQKAIDKEIALWYNSQCSVKNKYAGVAQWQSSWFVISRLMVRLRSPAPTCDIFGGIPERPKGADCKSVVTDFGGPNPPSPTRKKHLRKQVLFSVIFALRRVICTFGAWYLLRKWYACGR